ncbi:putative quinol monooxygenase [Bosea sp. RAF48]|uniref:putative quinol monooxygenase n=1 Tax=Bosea sp. RAF48 TaxID=3237480 RepID=UPI003F919664
MSQSAVDLPLPDADETGPYALMGTARAKPGEADALETHLLSLVAPTRLETGALAYHVHRDRNDPDLFAFYEVWSSREALAAHLKQPYIAAFLADRTRYLEGDLQIRWLRMASRYPTRL